jgi:hypothetical protein
MGKPAALMVAPHAAVRAEPAAVWVRQISSSAFLALESMKACRRRRSPGAARRSSPWSVFPQAVLRAEIDHADQLDDGLAGPSSVGS